MGDTARSGGAAAARARRQQAVVARCRSNRPRPPPRTPGARRRAAPTRPLPTRPPALDRRRQRLAGSRLGQHAFGVCPADRMRVAARLERKGVRGDEAGPARPAVGQEADDGLGLQPHRTWDRSSSGRWTAHTLEVQEHLDSYPAVARVTTAVPVAGPQAGQRSSRSLGESRPHTLVRASSRRHGRPAGPEGRGGRDANRLPTPFLVRPGSVGSRELVPAGLECRSRGLERCRAEGPSAQRAGGGCRSRRGPASVVVVVDVGPREVGGERATDARDSTSSRSRVNWRSRGSRPRRTGGNCR